MFPFWDVVVAPVLEAAEVRKVTEIGALAGDNTELMLRRLGADVELHVIDPVPQFDPSEHERRFKGQYIFHRDLSLNVIEKLEPMDAVLLDGDHNWYTVFHELQQIANVPRREDAPLPVLVLHDVCFPYGRRDLYYAPDQIPAEFRQPYARRGILPGRVDLVPERGGINPTMCNALQEGGPRNGVMTGLEDFIASYEKPLRLVVLPIYFGLAIVVEEERLERQPALAKVLDELEGTARRQDLLELAEQARVRDILFHHNVYYHRDERLAAGAERYLKLLKSSLLDDQYFENELRLDYLLLCLESGRTVSPAELRDPARMLPDRRKLIRAARESGGDVDGGPTGVGYLPYTEIGRARLDALHADLDVVRSDLVAGDLVDCGTGRGGAAMFIRGYLAAHWIMGPKVHVLDSFKASRMKVLPNKAELRVPKTWFQKVRRSRMFAPVPAGWAGMRAWLPSLNTVRDAFERFGLLDGRVNFIQGSFPRVLGKLKIDKIALLRIGTGSGDHAAEILDALYDKVPVGGFIIIEDYAVPECRRQVDEFRAKHSVGDPVHLTDERGARWRKLGAEVSSSTSVADDHPAYHDLTLDVPTSFTEVDEVVKTEEDANLIDLSVVVLMYNMKREAARTLRSLSRSYQRGIEDLDYEVIVVENGSTPEQHLGSDFVTAFGPEFRYIDMGADAQKTPVPGLNRGMAAAKGRNIALMIDGAHVLTPGVLRYAMSALSLYEPAVVATQQWYVGPGQQNATMNSGYDRAFEDRLFTKIDWPKDGYRLFDIGHFIGERDWLDGVSESNCLFAPRWLLEQSGGFDDDFDMPAAGFANLDLFEKLGASPGVTIATILGEGSFHQIHEGTTTNLSEIEARHALLGSYRAHYEDLRGREFTGPGKDLAYVGSVAHNSRRTRARRLTASTFTELQATGEPDGLPDSPTPMPQELGLAYTEAFWRSLAWQKSSWLGNPIEVTPSDLMIYQEILAGTRPDWVVVVGDDRGSRARFFASILELLGHGKVAVVGPCDLGEEGSDRITLLGGDPFTAESQSAAHDLVGSGTCVVVVTGPRGDDQVRVLFEAYHDLVPIDSYLVVEGGIVNGYPVWPGFGAGPGDALKRIRDDHPQFYADLELQRYFDTFNPSGYLKRRG